MNFAPEQSSCGTVSAGFAVVCICAVIAVFWASYVFVHGLGIGRLLGCCSASGGWSADLRAECRSHSWVLESPWDLVCLCARAQDMRMELCCMRSYMTIIQGTKKLCFLTLACALVQGGSNQDPSYEWGFVAYIYMKSSKAHHSRHQKVVSYPGF